MNTGDKDPLTLLVDGDFCGGGPASQPLGTFDIPEAFGTTPDGTVVADVFNVDLAAAGSGAGAAGGDTQKPSSPAAAGSGAATADTQKPSSPAAAGSGAATADTQKPSSLDAAGSGAAAAGGDTQKPSSPAAAGSGAGADGGYIQKPSFLVAAGSGAAAARTLDPQYPSSLVAAGYGAEEAGCGQLEPQEPSSLEVEGMVGDEVAMSVQGSGAAAARGGGLANRKRLAMSVQGSGEAACGRQIVGQKPPSLAAAGMGGGEDAGSMENVITRHLPPRAAANAGYDSDGHSSSSRNFSDDDTEKDVVHTSDGNMSVSDGWCSIIGSNDGEGSGVSESSYHPSSTWPSNSSDDTDGSSYAALSESTSTRSDDRSHGSIVSCEEEDDELPCMDRPIGMMLAKANPDDSHGNFVCSKVRQKYDNAGSDVFEVVFKDGSKTEYSREEVVLYKNTYDNNKGDKGCVEFFFKV